MVADPRDLDGGRAESPIQGDAALAAIRRRNADALKLTPTTGSPDVPDLKAADQSPGSPK
jgi:hypothetical protein